MSPYCRDGQQIATYEGGDDTPREPKGFSVQDLETALLVIWPVTRRDHSIEADYEV